MPGTPQYVRFFKKIKPHYDIYMIDECYGEKQIKIFEFENEFEFLKMIYLHIAFPGEGLTKSFVIPELKILLNFQYEFQLFIFYPFERNPEITGLLESFELEGFNIDALYQVFDQNIPDNEL